jgi:hypothetical protein
MNVAPEVLEWVRKAFAVIFRYPGEWSDVATARRALSQASQVQALVLEKLGLTGET